MTTDVAVTTAADLGQLARILDPAFYRSDPHPVYARMRAEAPVLFLPEFQTWALTRQEDIRQVLRTPAVYSSKRGILPCDIELQSPAENDYHPGDELLSTTDPPRHIELRRAIAPAFTPRAVSGLEAIIRETSEELVDRIDPGSPVEFVDTVAKVLPVTTVLGMLGCDTTNVARFNDMNDALFQQVAKRPDEAEGRKALEAFEPLNRFLAEQLEDRRQNPRDDILSALVRDQLDESANLSPENIEMLASVLMVAGDETTRTLLGNIVYSFALHPEQLELLAADRTLAANAVEEVLRWCPVHHGFIRYVAEDTELRGQLLRAGDFVYMLHEAANRDEEVFGDDAELFDIQRANASTHLGFALGQHFCPGAHLARLEARVLLETLVRRFPRWSLADEPQRLESNFSNEFEKLPVVFES